MNEWMNEHLCAQVLRPVLSLCDPMDYTDHGILQARILERVAVPFSRGSSQPKDWTQVSRIAAGFFTIWASRKPMYVCKCTEDHTCTCEVTVCVWRRQGVKEGCGARGPWIWVELNNTLPTNTESTFTLKTITMKIWKLKKNYRFLETTIVIKKKRTFVITEYIIPFFLYY